MSEVQDKDQPLNQVPDQNQDIKKAQVKKKIIDDFCNREIDDEDVINPRVLQLFSGIYHEKDDSADAKASTDQTEKLKGKFFLGLNVKTDSEEGLKPIPFFWPKGYTPAGAVIAEGGSIPDMFDIKTLGDYRPEQSNKFEWNPNHWDPKKETNIDAALGGKGNSSVETENSSVENKGENKGENRVIQKMFRTPYGPNYVPKRGNYDAEKNPDGNKYNILGEIYYNALHLKGGCHVLIYFFDYDLTNGKNLSFVFAVCELKEDMEIIEKKLNDLLNFILLVKARYVRRIQHQRQVESMKTAVASIMSRNMSHNLGSHYLYYTKNQLAKLAEKHETIGPEIRGAAKVLGYIQARMDYLATIVSEDKYPYGSVFFKGQVFDELTIDDFSRRHFPDSESNIKQPYRRTVNYLLQNLILSENFTREPVYPGQDSLLPDPNDPDNVNANKTIRLQVKTEKGMFNRAEGSSETRKDEDNRVKLDFSKICVALPGGIMSIHAFFNVLENFIRNSAKYLKEDFDPNGLIFTIAINELPENKAEKLPARYEFVFYDNKRNANKPVSDNEKPNQPQKQLVEWMNDQLGSMKFLTENNELDKHSKGLKEMLFSTLWMRAYSWLPAYAKYNWKRMADKLVEFDEMVGREKLEAIMKHTFAFVAVDNENQDVIYQYKYDEREGAVYYMDDESHILPNDCNLGICFELPKYRMLENIEVGEMEANLNQIGLYNFRDIICVYKGKKEEETIIQEQTTGQEQRKEEREERKEREEREEKKGLFGKSIQAITSLIFGIVGGFACCSNDDESKNTIDAIPVNRNPEESKNASRANEEAKQEDTVRTDTEVPKDLMENLKSKFTRVYFRKAKDVNDEKEAVDIFHSVLKERFPDFDDYRLGMNAIKEKGFNDNRKKGIYFKQHVSKLVEMNPYAYCEAISGENFTDTMRNIFTNGYVNAAYKDKATEYFALKIKESALTRITLIDERFYKDMITTKNKDEYLRLKNVRVLNLRDIDNVNEIPDTFIGMFEGSHFTDESDMTHFLSIHLGMIEKIVKDESPWIKKHGLVGKSMDVRVKKLFEMLRDTFKISNDELFISVHSGRGNFSAELDKWLKGYPFISISAIESVYANSKFLLSQLFYNTVYIGKGEMNEQGTKEA